MKHIIKQIYVIFIFIISTMFLTGCYQEEPKDKKVDSVVLSDVEINTLLCELEEYMYADVNRTSCYGGAYKENGKLIVNLTTQSKEIVSGIEKQIGSSGVVIKDVEYSIHELEELSVQHSDKYMELYQKGDEKTKRILDDFVGMYVSERDNRIVVQITEITDKKITQYENFFGKDGRVQFVEGGKISR